MSQSLENITPLQLSNFLPTLDVSVQVPITDCSLVEIPVPFQPKLHKQWCLFDQAENIDFDIEVKKIENNKKSLQQEENGQDLAGDEIFAVDIDLRTPGKRAIDPIFTDFSELEDFDRFAHPAVKPRYKKKRHTEQARGAQNTNKHVTANTKIVRMTKQVSHQ